MPPKDHENEEEGSSEDELEEEDDEDENNGDADDDDEELESNMSEKYEDIVKEYDGLNIILIECLR